MIDLAAIADIFSLYKKHGWTLRRILVTPELEKALAATQNDLLQAVEKRRSDIDGAWFSRASDADRETWELRLLGPTPFALLDVIGKSASETEREEALTHIEEKMREFNSRRAPGH